MRINAKIWSASLAAFQMVLANSAVAASATRSAEALPLVAASVGSVPYTSGAENTWRCVQVSDEVLKLDKKFVQVDAAGRVVMDPAGRAFTCRAPLEANNAGNGGRFPLEVLLGAIGAGGLIIALAVGGENDSPG